VAPRFISPAAEDAAHHSTEKTAGRTEAAPSTPATTVMTTSTTSATADVMLLVIV